MWLKLAMCCYIAQIIPAKELIRSPNSYTSIFREEQVIFSSEFNITSILVPADNTKYVPADVADIPSIFFTISNPKLEGGSCIYVLEGLAAYEVLEGGRDTTADYSSDKLVYFGARDGLYIYDGNTLSARKYGPFNDDITQLQKANNTDAIFILNSERKIYKIEKNGTVKTMIQSILCALEFVLDTSNNIYYIACDDRMPHIARYDGTYINYVTTVSENFKEIKLLRPAFIMDKCVPFFADGGLYILYANGTSEKKDFYIRERPTAYSIDATLYLVAALNGKIYEFNVMEVLLKSMFGVVSHWPSDVTKIIMSIVETAKDNVYKDWSVER
ncbi:hypothetical protein RR48_01751 [Papilio machaon]|uniref:Ommochrome-binding protein n=1 Tax=Papilio machaon TaxID=76193 RepID=A0A0N0PDB7_PAPMA|nr:uncharacterized protein LOC123722559 [Papilio machaon]KPJ16154.1 hypothetical protein RR48_01751 [Papilio machaon]